MSQERTCQGYKIVDSQRVGTVEIVLGHSLTAPQPYVTWKAYEHSDYKDFVYGHYFEHQQNARIDFYSRLAEAWRDYEPPKKSKEQHNSPERSER